MKCHSRADKALQLSVLFFLALFLVMQAHICLAAKTVIRTEVRPLIEAMTLEPASRKKPDSQAESYLCREQPLLLWSSSSTNAQFSFSREFKLLDSNQGPLLAEMKNAGEKRQVNIHSGEAVVEVSLLGPEYGYLRCTQVKDCTEEQIDSAVEGGAACLFIVRNKKGHHSRLFKPAVVRLIPPEQEKAIAGKPVMVGTGGALGGAPPGGPGGGGSPGVLEIFSYTKINDWFTQLLQQWAMQSPSQSIAGAIPDNIVWQYLQTGRWYKAVPLDVSCQVDGAGASTPEQWSRCDLFYQLAAAVALLAQSIPGVFTFMDQLPKSETQPVGGDGNTSDGEKSSGENADQGQQANENDQSSRDGEQSPPPSPDGATATPSGQPLVDELLAAAYRFVLEGLRPESSMSGQLMALVNSNPAIQALLSTLGTIEQQGSDQLRPEQVIDLFEAEGTTPPSRQHGLVATWLLHQLGVQSQPGSPWQWVLQQIRFPQGQELFDTIVQLFVETMRAQFGLQIAGNEEAAREAVQASGFTDLDAFSGALTFTDSVDQIYAITTQLENTEIEETGPVWTPELPGTLPAPLEKPEESSAVQLTRLEGALRSLLSELHSNPRLRPVLSQSAIAVQGGVAQQQLIQVVISSLQANPAMLQQLLPRLLMQAGLRGQCLAQDCQPLVHAHLFEPLPNDLPALTGNIGSTGSLHAALRVAVIHLVQENPSIARALRSVDVLQWMRYHNLLSVEQLATLARQNNAVLLVENVADAGAQVFAQWLHLLSRMSNLVALEEGLSSLFDRLLRDTDLGRTIVLMRNFEVIRYWPTELPESSNMMEYCRRLDPLQAGFLAQQGVQQVLLRNGLISHTSLQACQDQSQNCVSVVLGELQSIDDPKRVLEALEQYTGETALEIVRFMANLRRLIGLLQNPHGRQRVAVAPTRSNPVPIVVPAVTAAAGNRHAEWLGNLNAHQDLQLPNLAELVGDLYGSGIISYEEYDVVTSMPDTADQAQEVLRLLAATSEDNLQTVVQKIDKAKDAVRNALSRFRTELSRRLSGQSEQSAAASVPDLATEDLRGYYQRAVTQYPRLAGFTEKQNETGLKRSSAVMARKLGTMAMSIADLLKQAGWLTESDYETVKAEVTGRGKISSLLSTVTRRDSRYSFIVWIGVLLQLMEYEELDQDVIDDFVRRAGGL